MDYSWFFSNSHWLKAKLKSLQFSFLIKNNKKILILFSTELAQLKQNFHEHLHAFVSSSCWCSLTTAVAHHPSKWTEYNSKENWNFFHFPLSFFSFTGSEILFRGMIKTLKAIFFLAVATELKEKSRFFNRMRRASRWCLHCQETKQVPF